MFCVTIGLFFFFAYTPTIKSAGPDSTWRATAASDTVTPKYFYSDPSLKQSIGYSFENAQEEQQARSELLNALGISERTKRPRAYHDIEESAPSFIFHLYTALLDKQSGTIRPELDSEWEDILPPIGGQGNMSDSKMFAPHSTWAIAGGEKEETSRIKRQTLSDLVAADMIVGLKNQIRKQRQNSILRQHRERRFWFNVADLPRTADLHVIDAELRIYRDLLQSRLNSSHQLHLRLFMLKEVNNAVSNNIDKQIRLQYVDSMKIGGSVGGWLRFNVTEPLIEWHKSAEGSGVRNLGLYLQIRSKAFGKDLSPKLVGIINHSRGFKRYQPFMTAYLKFPHNSGTMMIAPELISKEQQQATETATPKRKRSSPNMQNESLPDDWDHLVEQQQQQHELLSTSHSVDAVRLSRWLQRHRRAAEAAAKKNAKKRQTSTFIYYDHDSSNEFLNSNAEKSEKSDPTGTKCTRKSMHVHFQKLKWNDWVLAPDSFQADYCEGLCNFPISSDLEPTNHAILQHLLHLLEPQNVPKPCCVPKELSPIMVLYFDDDANVVLKKFRNMVVSKCSCQ